MYKRLNALLKERGITPYRLAKELGISQSSLSEWKRGNSIPKNERLIKIAAYFNMPVSFLTGHDENMPVSDNNQELLDKLMKLAKEKLDAPEWSDEQAMLNHHLFNSLTEDKKVEALRYLRYLVSLQEDDIQ